MVAIEHVRACAPGGLTEFALRVPRTMKVLGIGLGSEVWVLQHAEADGLVYESACFVPGLRARSDRLTVRFTGRQWQRLYEDRLQRGLSLEELLSVVVHAISVERTLTRWGSAPSTPGIFRAR